MLIRIISLMTREKESRHAVAQDIRFMDGSLWFDSKISNVIKNSISEKKEIKTLKIDEEYNLTDREKQVLEYICEGLNNNEISKLLDVSVNTVKVHVSSIILKLNVEDRTQVVVKAFKMFYK